MGPLIIMVVLVCGFWYTQNHYPSRIKLARSNGWNAYFYVAMHGCRFALQGFAAVSLLFGILFILSHLTKMSDNVWVSIYTDLYTWMTDVEIMSYPLFLVLSLVMTACLAIDSGNQAKRALENDDFRQCSYKEIAAQDGLEALLVQAIDEGRLIFVTLKSRKVYIGYVAAPRMEYNDTLHLAIIPYISGYRDKDTLRYHEQHRYFDLYLRKNITADSAPLNITHFRHVIPMDQIENISLFDTDTYKSFDEYSVSEPACNLSSTGL